MHSFGPRNSVLSSVGSPHKFETLLHGSFQFNGASAPTNIVGNWIDSVAHTSTGVWTLTMKEGFWNWATLLDRHVSLELDASAGYTLSFGAIDKTAGTIIVRALDSSGIQAASKNVGFADLTDSDGAQTFAFAAALPADAVVLGGALDVTAGFTDGSSGVFTADLGVNGADIDSVLDGADIASIATVSLPVGTKHAGYYGAITPAVTVLADVDVDTATAGDLDAYVYYQSAEAATLADIAAGSNDGNWCHLTLNLKYADVVDGAT